MTSKRYKWYPDKVEGQDFQDLVTWLNYWGNLEKQGIVYQSDFYQGYKKAITDVMDELNVEWKVVSKKIKEELRKWFKMGKTRFTGRFTKSGKKIMELEVEQKDCDEMNALAKKLGLDKFPDFEEDKPTKLEFLFG